MKTAVVLDGEIHANTRRTRITYQARVGDEKIALKCYKAPLFGLLHWLRASRKSRQIRQRTLPFPDVLFSGWFARQRCFSIGYRYLEGYRPVRDLVEERSEASLRIIERLMVLLVRCQEAGVEQTDANLTNFLISENQDIAVVDEDAVKLHPGPMPEPAARANLASAMSRVGWLTRSDLASIWDQYSKLSRKRPEASFEDFMQSLDHWHQRLQQKRERKDKITARKRSAKTRPAKGG